MAAHQASPSQFMYLHTCPEFQLFLEYTPTAVAMFDRHMRYMAATRRWLTDYGFQQESYIGREHYEIFPQTPDKWKTAHQLCLTGCTENSSTDSFVREDGSVEWVKWKGCPWYDCNGEIGGTIFSSEIIIESKYTQEAEIEKQTALATTIKDISQPNCAETDVNHSEAQFRELYRHTRQAALNAQKQAHQLERTIEELKKTQTQLVQSEKMSSLGQLVAGVAHEINNPVNFIFGNIVHANGYVEDLLNLLKLYQQTYPQPTLEILEEIDAIDLDFLMMDLPKLLNSMKIGADRIREIVRSLRNFSRHDEAQMKAVDIREGIDSTLMILQHRLKATTTRPEIKVIKDYEPLPLIACYAGQLNQVFMNLLANAIDALEEQWIQGNYAICNSQLALRASGCSKSSVLQESQIFHPKIRIATKMIERDCIAICIADNGSGMTPEVQKRLFDPFFTTKPVGVGTGLGLSISYQIVEKHGGKLYCRSKLGQGTEFVIEIPIHHLENT
ncbi:PAS domain-containing protein [Scytonema sp. UIC 10036]|uniref:ATP-binding protein n=1 Tax=Scytonema sp. UIC 10036 TaxID=2304196 RepID=UPI0012DAF4A6|nr:ATP-binding protein [Scytonema sp. UIC 10036]MUG95083.1 PAS domain-containing protein [Scytonema sp. UIC 10036]